MSTEELASIIPVRPPIVNSIKKPHAHSSGAIGFPFLLPNSDANHLKILIPVGIPIIIVAAEKYARVSISKPTVNMWWAQTTNPKKAIDHIA